MTTDWLTAKQAAERLGISVLTLYDWLAQSDRGEYMIRGQAVVITYFQGGRRGQGKIQIQADEIDRLQEFMRVKPHTKIQRREPVRTTQFPGISVPLGRPK